MQFVLKSTTTLTHKTYQTDLYQAGPDEFLANASTASVDAAGDVIEPKPQPASGNVPLLMSHDPMQIIGRAYFWVAGGIIKMRGVFTPEGIDPNADLRRKQVKAGIIDAVSIGFSPLTFQPIQGSRGKRYTSIRIEEISLVACPCNYDAKITSKALQATVTPTAPVAQRSGITGQGVAQTATEVTGISLYEAESQRRAAHCRKVAESAPPTRADRLLKAAKYRSVEDQLGCLKPDHGGDSYEYFYKGMRKT